MKTYDGERVIVITKQRSNDEWIEVEMADGTRMRCRLWYLREQMESDKHITRIPKKETK